ncbi:MAG: D-2-hydroxyacid dehydrogenase [Gammaproteobacteria bacterium]|nr:D-2-hydroxyacid dehydrogenase [Gammaproteobacteria bacterium]
MKNAVVLDRDTLGQDVNLTSLSALFTHCDIHSLTPAAQVVERCQGAQVIITNKVQLSRAVLSQLPALKLIAVAATGTNNIDLEAAEELAITVINVQGYAGPSVAQHAFSLILQLTNQARQYQTFINDGLWQKSAFFCNLDYPMIELAGKKFGLVGFGSLGQATAKLAQAFGMKLLIAERPGATTIREERVSFEQMLQHADIVSLHCPQTKETEQLINRDSLKLMKSSALLINTARGGLINEPDLVAALINGDIAGAALDVLSTEPPVAGNCLLDYQGANLVITPHIAWASVEARQRLVDLLTAKITTYITDS